MDPCKQRLRLRVRLRPALRWRGRWMLICHLRQVEPANSSAISQRVAWLSVAPLARIRRAANRLVRLDNQRPNGHLSRPNAKFALPSVQVARPDFVRQRQTTTCFTIITRKFAIFGKGTANPARWLVHSRLLVVGQPATVICCATL